MAKTNVVQIKLVSSADTGYFYVTKKNARTVGATDGGASALPARRLGFMVRLPCR